MENLKKYIQHNTECNTLFKKLYDKGVICFPDNRVYAHYHIETQNIDCYYSIYSLESIEGDVFVYSNKYVVKDGELIKMIKGAKKHLTDAIGEVITEEEFNNVINNLYMY